MLTVFGEKIEQALTAQQSQAPFSSNIPCFYQCSSSLSIRLGSGFAAVLMASPPKTCSQELGFGGLAATKGANDFQPISFLLSHAFF